jgi:hypothetical protein
MADLDGNRKGTIACQESNGRAQAYGTARYGTRVIWLKLDCLNPNFQQVKMSTRRKPACNRCRIRRWHLCGASAPSGMRGDAQ